MTNYYKVKGDLVKRMGALITALEERNKRIAELQKKERIDYPLDDDIRLVAHLRKMLIPLEEIEARIEAINGLQPPTP